MYRLTPKKTNNKAQSIMVVLLLAASSLMLISALLKEVISYIWTVQLASICFFIGAIYVVARYLTKNFVYEIVPSERGFDLTVSESYTSRKNLVTVCRIGRQSIKRTAVLEGSAAKDELRKLKEKGRRVYDYRPDISPEKSIALLSDEGGVEVVILLAFDVELLHYLVAEDRGV